jgi:hypothetical protein
LQIVGEPVGEFVQMDCNGFSSFALKQQGAVRKLPEDIVVSVLFSALFECIAIRQLVAIEAHRPSHPISTEEADGLGAAFPQEAQ